MHEIAGLNWAVVDLKAGKVRVTGKGGRDQHREPLQLSPGGLGVMVHRADGHVLKWKRIETLRAKVHDLCERAEVTKRGVHALRHYSGTYMYKQTRNLAASGRRAARPTGLPRREAMI